MQGMILADRYECLKRIGSGGMGDVYKAHDRRLDRIVAIKVLKSEYNEDDNFIRKFRRESLAAASISHPNIVSIYDVGMETVADEDVYYIVMEYIDGKTLKELIKEEGMLSQNQALNYLIQIAEALKIAHSKNIIHRDIKSQNIMVTRDNRVKVTDFGIARMAGNATVTVTNAVMGSVHYFSPEQARGQKVDARSDIYSMGIVLFEMLTGEVPFDSENPITVALMHVQNEIPMPSERNPRVSPEVDRVFRHMTEKKPSDRYENVSLIIEDVKAILLGKVYGDPTQTETRTTVVIPPRGNRMGRETLTPADTAPQPKRSTRPMPVKKPKKKAHPLATMGGVLLALLLLFGLAFGGSKIKDMLISNQKNTAVEMIDLIGKDVSEAKDFAASNDLNLEIDEKESDEGMKPGTILSQSVDAGEVIKRGDQFSIVIAKEKEKVKVPDLENMTISEAQATLKTAGLNLVVDKTEFSEQVPTDRIIRQTPKSNEELAKGDSVHVVMSKGQDDKTTVVPNLKGVSVEKARALLKEQGLKLGNVEEREDISVGPGEVVWQQYNSGNQVKQGTSVDIIVSKRPGNEESTDEENTNTHATSHKNISYKVPDDGNTHEIEVIVQSGGSDRVVNHEEVGGGSSVSYPVQGRSGDKAVMRIDGSVVKTVNF
ncbi:MAG: Stk1 family PASTA domain-containing Ser/Thr kinase [Peptoniphilus sp.]|nr:Stk1 family PASTA domain-containing Ser/Thr kinase [Peptoniphilus sp.]MDY3119283.1 Stk1 family PASTA domain-containing Ser/Thr kinase [Peptoniphilus sp.]